MKKVLSAINAALLLAGSLTACGTQQTNTQTANVAAEIQPQTVSGAEPTADFLAAQTKFALDLLKYSVNENAGENVLVSPYSVMQALAMTANGANGDTLTEMENVLGGGMPINELNEYLFLWRNGQPATDDCKLKTANSVWFRDDAGRMTVMPDFLQTNADYYGADIFRKPFDNGTLNEINGWVNEKTDAMIPQLIDSIPDSAVMYLMNAVAFEAKWATPYEDEPQNRDFYGNGSTVPCQMMYSDEGTYLEDENACGFYKPYQGGRYAFVTLLPDEGTDVSSYVAGLTPERLASVIAGRRNEDVNAGLPKFSYDYDISLVPALKEMGMPAACEAGADFSKMIDPNTDLVNIDAVIHKTHIDVDTEGTKAAAATAVVMCDGAMMMEQEPKYVICDRPFVYMILDTEYNLPVFIGVLNTTV